MEIAMLAYNATTGGKEDSSEALRLYNEWAKDEASRTSISAEVFRAGYVSGARRVLVHSDHKAYVLGADSNAHGVLRKGYIDESGKWNEPALAIRNMFYQDGVRFGNWVDTDILEEEIWLMCKYYGNCKSVVEVNKDRGLIELQKKRGNMDI